MTCRLSLWPPLTLWTVVLHFISRINFAVILLRGSFCMTWVIFEIIFEIRFALFCTHNWNHISNLQTCAAAITNTMRAGARYERMVQFASQEVIRSGGWCGWMAMSLKTYHSKCQHETIGQRRRSRTSARFGVARRRASRTSGHDKNHRIFCVFCFSYKIS